MLKGHTDCVWCVATCTAGGRVLAVSGSDDMTVRVWDVEAGKLRTVLKGHTATVYGVATCTVGGRVLAVSASRDKTLRVWDVGAGALRTVLEGHTSHVSSVATCSAGGRVLAVSRGDKTLRIWGVGSVAHDETICHYRGAHRHTRPSGGIGGGGDLTPALLVRPSTAVYYSDAVLTVYRV